ncbi:bifunctional D-glycero-beta-D-manno-heptose-7-phosphate kinase/D-glycero-beta-D-manno-heptose 1-phosphate adenylyltransferase HldE [Catenovulum sp. 2E275]|uniref:bifunctional D-glycero-beta-D-manno-heptose-7-phosphate kinase/D-glycero-beta-D-manno-heptose 1-phosphate adenylyltransferase HldE n=1 Tax=Catenovulum sp. 2E275 TaxID=2980497 RepID=UPI0021CECDCF|nr:bifunctional D-glycero-beta-D-manno-heptose-7-phosphate kinase/D-glycero-beta-D-manno-heptose 1-phosphate adenylyltransferase HldE [Catenovulum sp. 2E275]MCU4674228.1 bifunctional D-glycero-beta-D-manno-heptose-7-phosphate kinase/D-glycero-beta-D-manno-heptose 1-phosphate adenylyltransferase HldE [Catenovulum sp. 2E275]
MDLSVFSRLSKANILVVGDVMLDRYFIGDSQRISPEAPVPVVKITQTQDKVGGAANVARNVAHLDGKVGLLGIVGHDENGEHLKQLLAQENIQSELVEQNTKPTITKLRVVSRHQQVVRLDFEETFELEQAGELQKKFEAVLDNYQTVIFSDYNKGSLGHISQMIQTAKQAGKIILVDPKQSDLNLYRGATVITPNLGEFKLAGGNTTNEETITQSARQLIADAGIDSILLTRSEQGMSAISQTEKTDMPAEVLEVSDVTGAGDTVIATLAVMLSVGLPLADAAKMANTAAGIVVAKLGAATVKPEELAAKFNQQLLTQGLHYQCPFDDVLQHIEFAKQAGEKIVFTNGCFDILHAGHVAYLEKAKALGHRLVLGLNTDESISRLKGPDRPVNPLEQRAVVMTALKSVDWVIPFGEAGDDTPLKLIEAVKPDVLVKGGDYTVDTIVGAEFVQQNGGEVVVIEFVDGCSTTNVIKKIRG